MAKILTLKEGEQLSIQQLPPLIQTLKMAQDNSGRFVRHDSIYSSPNSASTSLRFLRKRYPDNLEIVIQTEEDGVRAYMKWTDNA